MSENEGDSECRACLSFVAVSGCRNIFLPWNAPWSAFGSTIACDLARVANIEVTDLDNQPHMMCQSCCLELFRSCQFIATVQKTAEVLQERSKREQSNLSDPQMWPKPIDLEKNINGDMFRGSLEVEIKQEAISDDDSYNTSMMDIKVESVMPKPKSTTVVTKTTKVTAKGKAKARITNGSEKYEHVEYLDQPLKDEPRSEEFDLPLECMLCAKKFQSVSGLKAHVIAQHSYKGVKRKTRGASTPPKRKPDTYVCATCRRAFATPTDLMVHETCHNKSVCYGCNQNFDSFDQLRKHRRRCNATKAPKPRTKTLEDALRPPPTPWKCTTCNETLSDIYYMNIHNEIHHNSQAKSDQTKTDQTPPQNEPHILKEKVTCNDTQLENELLEHLLGHEDPESPVKTVPQSTNEKVIIRAEKVKDVTRIIGQDSKRCDEKNFEQKTVSSERSSQLKIDIKVETQPKQADIQTTEITIEKFDIQTEQNDSKTQDDQKNDNQPDYMEQSSNENNLDAFSIKNLTDEDKIVANESKTQQENTQKCTEVDQMDVDQTDGKENSENVTNIRDTEESQSLQDVGAIKDDQFNKEQDKNNKETNETNSNLLEEIDNQHEESDGEDNSVENTKDTNIVKEIDNELEDSNLEEQKKADKQLLDKKDEQLEMIKNTPLHDKKDQLKVVKDNQLVIIPDTPLEVIQDNLLEMKHNIGDDQEEVLENAFDNSLQNKSTEFQDNKKDNFLEDKLFKPTVVQQSDNSLEAKQDYQLETQEILESLQIGLDVENTKEQENQIADKEPNSETDFTQNLDKNIVQEKGDGDFGKSEDVQKIEIELLPQVLDENV